MQPQSALFRTAEFARDASACHAAVLNLARLRGWSICSDTPGSPVRQRGVWMAPRAAWMGARRQENTRGQPILLPR